jgi:hypothetical protein
MQVTISLPKSKNNTSLAYNSTHCIGLHIINVIADRSFVSQFHYLNHFICVCVCVCVCVVCVAGARERARIVVVIKHQKI